MQQSKLTWAIAIVLALGWSYARDTDAAEVLPPRIEALFVRGKLTFSDVRWVRIGFSKRHSEANSWRQLKTLIQSAQRNRKAKVFEKLEALQIRLAGSHVTTDRCYGDSSCDVFEWGEAFVNRLRTRSRFDHAFGRASVLFQGYQLAVQASKQWAQREFPSDAFVDQVRIHTTGEQLYRSIALDLQADGGAATSEIDLDTKYVLQGLARLAATREDVESRIWLESVITNSGWPSQKEIGSAAWESAWRIVLHARDDPEFQLRALDLARLAVKEGRLTFAEYATRYDKVMYEITGKQLYGTRVDCISGKLVVVPVEDLEHLEQRRSEAGLNSMTAWLAEIPRDSCR